MATERQPYPTGFSVGQSAQPASPIARFLSGSIGSLVYHLTFTPLEVVKTRQQAAGSGLGPSSRSPSPVKAFLRGRGLVVLNNGFMLPKNAFPCLVAPQYRNVSPLSVCSRLFESTSCQSIMQHHLDKSKSGGIISTLRSISRTEGRAGLYAGLKPTLLAAVPNTAIYFTVYDEIVLGLREYQGLNNRSNEMPQLPVHIPLLAGATARFISSVATAPLEVVRTRQASTIGNSNSILEEFRLILRMNGPYALYKGLGPMILRDVPFSALYFLSLENFKSVLSRSENLGAWGKKYYEEREERIPESVEVLQAFISGSGAGAFATMVTTPFDVIKTRRQMVSQTETRVFGPGKHYAAQGTFQLMRQIVQEEGIFTGLWKGNQTRLVKIAPGYGIMISCYELSKRLFEDMM